MHFKRGVRMDAAMDVPGAGERNIARQLGKELDFTYLDFQDLLSTLSRLIDPSNRRIITSWLLGLMI